MELKSDCTAILTTVAPTDTTNGLEAGKNGSYPHPASPFVVSVGATMVRMAVFHSF